MEKRPLKSDSLGLKIVGNKELFDALGRVDSDAVRQLAAQILPGVRQAVFGANLPREEAEKLVNDALLITIENIQNGKYQFQNLTPAAYANGVIRNLISARVRKKKLKTVDFDAVENISDFDAEEYETDKVRENLVMKMFSKLGENCQKILRLKYFDNKKDKEIIDKQLAPFSNINSLKSMRSRCLRQLKKLTNSL